MNFIHVITTRFNVPTSIWTETRDGKKPLSEEWLKDRFEIFKKYCLPSFITQSTQNFYWFVFFDENTPEIYLQEIKNIQIRYPSFQPKFVKNYEEMYTQTIEGIQELCIASTKYIITSDIDNDDLLHQNYIKTIQELYQPQHDLVIDLKRGLQLTKISNSLAKINVFYMVANPFVSLVEDVHKYKTVLKHSHTTYRDYPNYVSYDAQPMFIQYIHSNNLVNTTRNNAQRLWKLNFSDYGIAQENHFKISTKDAIVENFKRKFYKFSKLVRIKKSHGKS